MTFYVLWTLLFITYFFPSIVGAYLKHHNAVAILALNLFLGWTMFGWVCALVWALTSDAPKRST
jgi:T4 superinfection immunity protein